MCQRLCSPVRGVSFSALQTEGLMSSAENDHEASSVQHSSFLSIFPDFPDFLLSFSIKDLADPVLQERGCALMAALKPCWSPKKERQLGGKMFMCPSNWVLRQSQRRLCVRGRIFTVASDGQMATASRDGAQQITSTLLSRPKGIPTPRP